MTGNARRPRVGWTGGGSAIAAVVLLSLAVAGCASKKTRPPVEDRVAQTAGAAAAPGAPAEASPPLPGAENAGKPGYYSVRAGDTLVRIALDNGQNWRDLVKWNKLENPNVIEVGQVLRVVPPGVDPSVAATRPVAAPRVDTRPIERPAVPVTAGSMAASATPGAAAPASGPAVAPSAPGSSTGAAAAASTAASAAAAPRDGEDELPWIWPASGAVVVQFDETRSKGLGIAGKAGDPVVAAADGRVVYAGSGLRGYGNLVIVKHNNTYLTAYAHNQTLLVKEDQAVRRGQRIAEMGSTDAETVQLHFEIRRLGKPVDPAKLLPPR